MQLALSVVFQDGSGRPVRDQDLYRRHRRVGASTRRSVPAVRSPVLFWQPTAGAEAERTPQGSPGEGLGEDRRRGVSGI